MKSDSCGGRHLTLTAAQAAQTATESGQVLGRGSGPALPADRRRARRLAIASAPGKCWAARWPSAAGG